MSSILFMRDIVDQHGPIVAVSGDLSHVVAWNGDTVFSLFDTRTFDGEYVFVFEWMSDSINATSNASEVVGYALEWLEEELG